MKNYVPVLKKTRLFAGVAEDDLAAMLSCLKAGTGSCKKGNYVYRQGERVDRLSILVAGKLQIQKDDSWGNRTIVGTVGVGDMFGEEYVAPQSSVLLNDVMALEDSVIVTLDAMRVLTVCSSLCRFHTRVIQNLVFSISEKNRRLMHKLDHVSRRSTREKLISYLSEEAQLQGSTKIAIPFNRQQLADILSVDRSAMCKELARMRDEGMLNFEKNSFELL